MKTNYTLVIPEYKEAENFKLTEANVKETQKNCVSIQRISDTACMGTSYSRHAGIMKAETEVIITCDAHMRFMPEALDKMAEHIASSSKDILCCLTCHYNDDLDFDKSPYTGAKLIWKKDEPNSKRALVAEWDSNEPGEIAAVMGGCYGFKKSSYLKMGSPWRLGLGWGCDEETISIAMRLIGGTVELLEYRCAHQYLHNKPAVNLSPDEKLARLWYNRLRNLYYLPIDEDTAKSLRDYTLSSPVLKDKQDIVMSMLEQKIPEIMECAAILREHQEVSFDDFANKWVIGYKPKEPAKIEITAEPKRILEHECMNCTLKHLATARELLYRRNDMIMVLGHLACAFNHSGIPEIDDLVNRYQQISPRDITPVIKKLNLEQEFQQTKRTEQSSEQQCVEYLAISAVIAMEIATGYSTEEYHAALLGNLSIAQDLAVLKNAELANRIRGMRLWLYPDGVRIAKFRDIDIALIKDIAKNNFKIEDIPMDKRVGKPCGTCGKKRQAAQALKSNDIVIPIHANGSGHDDVELRYALRAIDENLINYRDIIIVCDNPPEWLRNVRVVKHSEMHRKNITLAYKWKKGAEASDAGNIITWCDDFVLLKKTNALSIPALRVGTTSMFNYHGKSVWHECLRLTASVLDDKGKTTFNCESHTPAVMNREKFLELMNVYETELMEEPGLLIVSLYQNYYNAPLQDMNIFKATFESKINVHSEIKAKTEDKMFIGYSDNGFNNGIKEFLQERFPNKCKYEV